MTTHAEQMMQQEEQAATEAWARMQAARAEGNRRAENRAWREHQAHRDAAARWRAAANRWEVSSTGFNS